MTDQTIGNVFPTLDFSKLPRPGTRLVLALMRRARAARDYQHLASLPDRLLDDVGIPRAEVERHIGRSAWTLRARTRSLD
jgi:uncharacterized protein YjiS (DUF1127 family)